MMKNDEKERSEFGVSSNSDTQFLGKPEHPNAEV
jgi:hypothetical protein